MEIMTALHDFFKGVQMNGKNIVYYSIWRLNGIRTRIAAIRIGYDGYAAGP